MSGDADLRSLYENALALYGARILDNVDLNRLPDLLIDLADFVGCRVSRQDP
jgi:hypothetical protein